MKFVKNKNINKIDWQRIKDAEILLFFTILDLNSKNGIMLIEDFKEYDLDEEKIIEILRKISKYFIITTKEEGFIIKKIDKKENNRINVVNDIFGLSKEYVKRINAINEGDKIKIITKELMERKDRLELSNKTFCFETLEDVKYMFNNITIGSLMKMHSTYLSKTDIKVIIETVIKSELDRQIIMFVIDQSILQNKYESFNSNFYLKVFNTYEKKKIESVEKAIDLKKEREKLIENTNSTYVEPTWEPAKEVTISEADMLRLEEFLNE